MACQIFIQTLCYLEFRSLVLLHVIVQVGQPQFTAKRSSKDAKTKKSRASKFLSFLVKLPKTHLVKKNALVDVKLFAVCIYIECFIDYKLNFYFFSCSQMFSDRKSQLWILQNSALILRFFDMLNISLHFFHFLVFLIDNL